jgi:hypothetical protein
MATNRNSLAGAQVELWRLEKTLGSMPRGAPNHSVEPTRSGLRPPRAAHLKR